MEKIAILGGGVTGLFLGWLLQKKKIPYTIFEKENYVGGLARSFQWNDFDCDFAAHRLFTENEFVLHELLRVIPMGRHIRRSKIYLNRKWLSDPLNIIELLSKLSTIESTQLLWSYIFRENGHFEGNFENFVLNRYGRKLYELFFQPYTEKLFSLPGNEISKNWAQMKVRLANPFDLIRESTKNKFNYFYYPTENGYGAIAKFLYKETKDNIKLDSKVFDITRKGNLITEIRYVQNDKIFRENVEMVISTLPLTTIGKLFGHSFSLTYQKVDSVYLHINKPRLSDFHWFYFVDKDISINRLVEFKNLSSINTPPNTTVVCSEVTQSHPDYVTTVSNDLEKVGLLNKQDILDSLVICEEFAYPKYHVGYETELAQAISILRKYKNLHIIGRASQFKHLETDDIFASATKLISETIEEIVGKNYPSAICKNEVGKQISSNDSPIYAIILTLNNFEDTSECIQSLFKLHAKTLIIVIVDNGSIDGTPKKIMDLYPDVRVIRNNSNIGVPAGYNVGFKYALENNAEFILMLNNDTVVHPQMLDNLLENARNDPNSGILMPKILNYGENAEIWSSGGRYRKFPPAILMTDKRKGSAETLRLIEYAPSCVLLINRRAFELAGLFDPGYFFYYDDWDFSERVRTCGLNIWYIPTAIAWHKVSRTTKGPSSSLYWYTIAASSIRYYRRHGNPVWLSLPIHLIYIFLREFIWKRNWKYWKYYYEGLKSGLQQPLGDIPNIRN